MPAAGCPEIGVTCASKIGGSRVRCVRGRVEARADGRRFILTVADDGIGFDAGAAPADGHRGLRNMADRARSLDGYLEVHSSPGRGTRVELVVPLSV
jgi:signal transduction histidine kinase